MLMLSADPRDQVLRSRVDHARLVCARAQRVDPLQLDSLSAAPDPVHLAQGDNEIRKEFLSATDQYQLERNLISASEHPSSLLTAALFRISGCDHKWSRNLVMRSQRLRARRRRGFEYQVIWTLRRARGSRGREALDTRRRGTRGRTHRAESSRDTPADRAAHGPRTPLDIARTTVLLDRHPLICPASRPA